MADLRKSVLIGRYKINKAIKGLTQYLSGVEQLDDVRYSTNVKNMDLILSGPVPPNPAELLNNEKFTELLETARKEYDYVIIDTPPIGQVIDRHCCTADRWSYFPYFTGKYQLQICSETN